MNRLTICLLATILFAFPALAQEWPERFDEAIAVDAASVVIENVTVIDGTGSAPMTGQTVLIQDGVIRGIGSDIMIPSGAHTIDGTGKTLIPGMIGLHNHTFYTTSQRRIQLDVTAPLLYLASGVTTIRTTGSAAPYSELELKRAINNRERIGPRMFVTGPYITGGEGYTYMTRLDGPEDARRVVRYWAEEGVDWFKAYNLITRDELAAAADEAHKMGIKITGHLCSVSFRDAVAAGIDNLEHGYFTNTDYYDDKPLDQCPSDYREGLTGIDMSSDDVQDTFRVMNEAGVGMTSTLAVYEMYVPNRPPLEQRVLDAMSPEVQKEYLQTRSNIADQNSQLWKELWVKALEYERAFVDAGGLLAAGVDPTGYGGALPGYGDQRNFELLHEAGFSTPEVMQIMSLNGATILGIADETGSIETGKHADLVLIDGDLTRDPALIRNVEIVFRDGVGFDSARIIEGIEGSVGVR
jgi:imidazolonepropionase-like amidohydrolase